MREEQEEEGEKSFLGGGIERTNERTKRTNELPSLLITRTLWGVNGEGVAKLFWGDARPPATALDNKRPARTTSEGNV